jgi:hypothetical protein
VTESAVERYLRLGLQLGRHVDGLRTYAGVLAGEPERFRRLLTEQVRVRDLLEAREARALT